MYERWREKKGWREQHILPEERTTWNDEWTLRETGGQSDRNKQNIKQKKQETEKQDVKQNDGQMEKDTGKQ